MRKLLIVGALALLTSCGSFGTKTPPITVATDNVDMHTAENSLDYAGVYSGTIPAADCPGIVVRLVLYNDGGYQMNMTYLERDSSFSQKGTYTVVGNDLIAKSNDADEKTTYYRVGENKLFMLNGDRQMVEGPLADMYTLNKEQNNE